MPKTKLIIALLVVGLSGAALIISHAAPFESAEDAPVELSSETHEVGDFYIDPNDIELDMADSYTFISYTEEATRSVSTQSDWTVLRDGSTPSDVQLEDCEDSFECTVFIGDVAGELTLTATSAAGEATATITVPESAEVELGFSDEIPDWAATDIAILNERNIMMGYSDGSFGAEDPVTRGQFITLLYRLMPIYGINTEAALDDLDCELYSDLEETHFAYDAICFATHYDWLERIQLTGSTIQADKTITRAETAQLFAGAIGEATGEAILAGVGYAPSQFDGVFEYVAGMDFEDVNTGTTYAHGIGVAYAFGIMTGTYEGGFQQVFKPSATLNRAETAVIIWRILSKIVSNVSEDVEFNIDDEVIEAFNSSR